ncbi:CYTH and CHAD domain-containing protein [Streptacidiphilus rugosus]|uniref:CYTH and CHAD domain-containing protein n=1 Tax=Streptacidiphilus rugosus TaxID=405783 RepID=UPI00068EF276|nr:CYTH and CHAD domain-containing protein [Streptacidiphilus rugosus]
MSTNAYTEHELTFDGVLARDLPSAARPAGVARTRSAGTEILDAVYFDTADHGLLRRGATLRRRSGGHDAGWHLKLPDGNGGRREIRRPLAGEGADGEDVPADLRQLAAVYARGRRLRPTAHLLTHRRRVLWLDRKERSLAEVAADHVAARVLGPADGDGGLPVPETELTTWDETEVELTGGDEALLDRASRTLQAQGLRPADHGVKLARALRAAGMEVTRRRRAEVKGSGQAAVAVVTALREHADRLTSLDPEVRQDQEDAVHRMRVTARRLRSLLRSCEKLFDADPAAELAGDLRWLGRRLGAYREPEALRDRLTGQARELPADCAPDRAARRLHKVLDRRCRRAHRALLDDLSSHRYFRLLDRLEEFVSDPPLRAGKHPGAGRAEKLLRHEKRRTRRRLRKALRQPSGERQDEGLHSARKAAKRTRYLAGALRPVRGSDAKKLERKHRTIHKRLGEHQDARSAEQALAELARINGTPPEHAFALGVLRSRQRDDSPADIDAARRAAGL